MTIPSIRRPVPCRILFTDRIFASALVGSIQNNRQKIQPMRPWPLRPFRHPDSNICLSLWVLQVTCTVVRGPGSDRTRHEKAQTHKTPYPTRGSATHQANQPTNAPTMKIRASACLDDARWPRCPRWPQGFRHGSTTSLSTGRRRSGCVPPSGGPRRCLWRLP